MEIKESMECLKAITLMETMQEAMEPRKTLELTDKGVMDSAEAMQVMDLIETKKAMDLTVMVTLLINLNTGIIVLDIKYI